MSKPQPDGTLVKALARGWRWQRMLKEGVRATDSGIGAAENTLKCNVSRILRLALLAPDLIEAVLHGRLLKGIRLENLMRLQWSGRCGTQPGGMVASGTGGP